VINFVAGSARELGTVLTTSEIPAMLTLIGSSQAGRDLVRDSATSIKRFSLELGGNAPVIVTKNADVASAATNCMAGKMRNCGQICVSPQRVFVERSVHDEFVAVAKSNRRGRQVRHGARRRQHQPHDHARIRGAPGGPGGDALRRAPPWWPAASARPTRPRATISCPRCSPTSPRHARLPRGDLWPPILAIMAYDDLDEPSALGNDTEYGLYSYAWTRDIVEANKIAAASISGRCLSTAAAAASTRPTAASRNRAPAKTAASTAGRVLLLHKSIRLALV
jgi:succinate-semialdehyde dehydrogenase/glutarate-semialdehyde dehydrogenase